MNKKKIIMIAVIVVFVIALIWWLSKLFGGKGSAVGVASEKSNVEMDQDVPNFSSMLIDASKKAISEVKQDSKDDKDEVEYVIYKINVHENEYYYNNKEISLSNLMESILNEKENVCVEISEDYASDNAYKKLINQLREAQIRYIEIQND